MKKIVRITESELVRLIKNIINEESIIVTNHDKSFDYKKDGSDYYFRGKGKYALKYPDWTLATEKESIESIKTKVFGNLDIVVDKKTSESGVKKSEDGSTKDIEKSVDYQEKKQEEPKDTKPQLPITKGSADKAIGFLMGKGLTLAQAAGIAGNLHKESGFNPTVKPGDRGTSFGIAQWHASRGENMKKWTKQNGYDPNSFSGQMEYLWWELNHTEKNTLSKLSKVDDPKEAAFMFAKYFERCAACQEKSRIKSRLEKAQEFYDNY